MKLEQIPKSTVVLGPTDVVCDRKVKGLCALPYEGHRKGCPNYGKRKTCPPQAPWFHDIYRAGVYAAILTFDFAVYLEMMAERHPGWTDRQLRNPLYWQGHLRSVMKQFVSEQKYLMEQGYEAVWVPEAMGVNVTKTCKKLEVELEWPPRDKTRIVVLFAKRW